jgi:hypothetical protein
MTAARHLALALALGLAFAFGCGGGVAKPKTGPQLGPDILAAARARPMPSTLSGTARMEAYVDGVARKAGLLLMVQRPDKAQIQAMTPTMEMIAVLATDGQRFTSFERGGEACRVGRACAANMARLVPLELPPDQLVAALLGRPPILEEVAPTARWDGERGAWKLVLERAPWRQELWVQPPQMWILASVMYRDGARVASVAYGEHGKLGAKGPPRRMRMRWAGDKVDVSLELRDVDLDEPIEADAFDVPCPRGMSVVELPCEGTASAAGGGR